MSNIDYEDDGLSAYRHALASQAPENSSSKQENRAMLRARFLNVLEYLQKNKSSAPIQLDFHREASLTAAQCLSVDSTFSQILVQDLQTPIGRMPTALIRTSDLTAVSFTLPSA